MELDEISHKVIGCAMKVHTKLGPSLLESACKECLKYETSKAGIIVR